ncbi:MAG: glutamate racemase [Streptococcaceae bacterium]|jgi:glutamate racemase|nr:glutamate racemase [Streptococcaceae bacterium]
MDNRPIGFLDSGVGGLTVVRQLFRQLPNEEVIYIGDTARMPYGPRSADEILRFTWDMVYFLLEKNVKMIVFACNTATAVALDTIRAQVNVPVVGVILPGANAAVQQTKSGKIGVIGTQATIKSNSYVNALHARSGELEILSLACPAFVPLVESGDFDNYASRRIVSETLQPLIGQVDTLILGCTHYPLLTEQIQTAMGRDVKLVDSGAEAVRDVSVLLNYFALNRELNLPTTSHYFTTGDAAHFKQIAEQWLNRPVDVKKVSFEQKKLLIATRNPGKVKEFKALFSEIGYNVESLNDYPDLPEIEETGNTFEENARLKAETISKITGQLVIADDSGLCVDVLGGLPGIWSHRFSAPDPTDQKNNIKLLHELASTKIKPEQRTAHFHCTIAAARPDHESLIVEADWSGRIALNPQGEAGFGYDPIFLVGEGNKTAAELSPQEKNKISHRGQALQKLLTAFPEWLSH